MIVVVLGGLIVYGLYDVDRAVSDERTDGPNSIFALVFMHLAAYSAATGVVTRAITLFMAVRKVPLEYRLLTTFAGLLLIPATLFALGVRG
ncbi:hypothetical protein sos41_31910 [Alphaproteobacteria bacterium SO-S41]|nr:hypothetical protein sos41_31910 [Alphaproteobacteria bacterium SO-S41]